MYKEVLSEMENIFKSHPKNAEILWPRCLGTRPNDRVILEDMTPKGYKMIDRLKRLDLEHARVVLQSLGRWVFVYATGNMIVSFVNGCIDVIRE